jgi:hypothetical protein
VKRLDQPGALLEELSLASRPLAELPELARAPHRELTFHGRQLSVKRLPESLADGATNVLAEPRCADGGAMAPGDPRGPEVLGRALKILEEVIAADPKNASLRIRQIDLCLRIAGQAVAAGDRGGCRAVIEGVLGFVPARADRSPPLHLAVGAAQAYRDQIIALGSGEKNAIPYQDGGRLAFRQLRLPQNVLLRPKLGWQLPAGRAQSRAVRTTKLRPVGAE